MIWLVWFARNLAIFQDKYLHLSIYGNRTLGIHNLLPQAAINNKQRISIDLVIDKEICCAFFDGASQETSTKGGVGGIIFINDSKFHKFAAGPEHASKNHGELITLRYTLLLAHSIGVRDIQIIGD